MAHDGKWRSFRVDGVWQKPGDTRRIPGTLTVSRSGGLSLRLIVDDLEAPPPVPGPIGIDPGELTGVVMVGETSDGRRFTLWDGFFRRGNLWSRIFRSVGRKELYFNHGIEGLCHDNPKELRFSRSNVRIGVLAGWLWRNNFQVVPPNDTDQAWTTLRCTHPMPLEYPMGDGRTLSLRWSVRGPAIRLFQISATVAIQPQLNITYADPAPLATCQADLMVVANLIQLLSGHPVMYRQLRLSSPSAQMVLANGRTISDELRLLGSQLAVSPTGGAFGPGSFLFPFPSLESRFNTLLRTWWQLYRANEHALGAYFAVNRWRRSFADERFFVMASAAESVHDFLNPHSTALTAQEWRNIRHAIQQALPSEHRSALLPKLSHLPRLTFAERIESLISDLPGDLRQRVIGDPQQVARFARRVKTLRNAKAHQLKHRTTGIELVGLSSKLRFLIDWALLRRIGLDGGEITTAIENCPEYNFYAYNQTWPWDKENGEE